MKQKPKKNKSFKQLAKEIFIDPPRYDYVNRSNEIAALKELYADSVQDLVYKENPFLDLVPKDE